MIRVNLNKRLWCSQQVKQKSQLNLVPLLHWHQSFQWLGIVYEEWRQFECVLWKNVMLEYHLWKCVLLGMLSVFLEKLL